MLLDNAVNGLMCHKPAIPYLYSALVTRDHLE